MHSPTAIKDKAQTTHAATDTAFPIKLAFPQVAAKKPSKLGYMTLQTNALFDSLAFLHTYILLGFIHSCVAAYFLRLTWTNLAFIQLFLNY